MAAPTFNFYFAAGNTVEKPRDRSRDRESSRDQKEIRRSEGSHKDQEIRRLGDQEAPKKSRRSEPNRGAEGSVAVKTRRSRGAGPDVAAVAANGALAVARGGAAAGEEAGDRAAAAGNRAAAGGGAAEGDEGNRVAA